MLSFLAVLLMVQIALNDLLGNSQITSINPAFSSTVDINPPFILILIETPALLPEYEELRSIKLEIRPIYRPLGKGLSDYLVTKQTSRGIEVADSTHCPFAHLIAEFRILTPKVMNTPGVNLKDAEALPPSMGTTRFTITNFNVPQKGGEPMAVTYSAVSGPIVAWAQQLSTTLQPCWKPVALTP